MIHRALKRLGPLKCAMLLTGTAALGSEALYLLIGLVIGVINLRGIVTSVVIPLLFTPLVAYFIFNIMARLIYTEEALRKSEERYRTIFEQSRDVIYCTTARGRVLEINQAGSDIFGFTPDEFKDLETMPAFEDLVRNEKEIDEPALRGQVKNREIVLFHKDGHEITCLNTAGVWRDKDGVVQGYIGTLRDITDLKRAEEENKKLERQLLQAQKMEAVGTLASGIAHDFNNILQAISGCIQLLQYKRKSTSNHDRYFQEADKAIERASDLVQRLLTFGRKVEPELKPIDLNEAVEHTTCILKRTIPKMVEIKTQLSSDLKKINADPLQLERVIMNLATNARDAMPDGGRLLIETNNLELDGVHRPKHLGLNSGAYVLLKVQDTGLGMDKATVDRIFEPFFTTKSVGKGTGLGMSTIYGIVKSHDGHISCYSEPGRGTTFNIYFPVLGSDGEPVDRKEEFDAETLLRGGETLLLVDDEKAVLGIAEEILATHGYRVLTAGSGEETLEIFKSRDHSIDLVVLDLGMPGMGGQRCLKELLALDPGIKVLIASGYSIHTHGRKVLESGAKGFINKPYRLVDMLKTIRSVLDESA